MLGQTLRQMIMGFRTTQMLHVAARLGIADQLRAGPQSAQTLAAMVGADAQALHRLLRALASMGIFAQTATGDFQLTPLAEALRRDAPGSLYGMALLYGDDWLWHAYGGMRYSVQTGLPAFEHIHGQKLFDYLGEHAEAATIFNQAMSAYSAQEAAAILAEYDFSAIAQLVDVGGGQGTLLIAILKAYPHLAGILFDLEHVVASAQPCVARAGVTDRCTCVAGDFFTRLPAGGDLYLLKSVIHDWADEPSLTILRHCRQAMGDQGRLLVVERVVPVGNTPAEAKLFDINMLVVLGGRERTEEEYRGLFQAAGFQLTQIIPTQSPLSLIEGIPIASTR